MAPTPTPQPQMKRPTGQMNRACPSCQFENPSYAEKFCIKCGSKLEPETKPSEAHKSEQILGTIEIDHKMLCFTPTRVIVANTKGIRGVAMGAAILFGPIGGVVAEALSKGAENMRRQKLRKLSLESVLKAREGNFAIPYSGIVRVEMKIKKRKIKIIADQKFGDDMKKKRDEITQKNVYVFEKKMEKKEAFVDHVKLVRSVLPGKVVVLT